MWGTNFHTHTEQGGVFRLRKVAGLLSWHNSRCPEFKLRIWAWTVVRILYIWIRIFRSWFVSVGLNTECMDAATPNRFSFRILANCCWQPLWRSRKDSRIWARQEKEISVTSTAFSQHRGQPNPNVQGYYRVVPQTVNRSGRVADQLSPYHGELTNKGTYKGTFANIRAF